MRPNDIAQKNDKKIEAMQIASIYKQMVSIIFYYNYTNSKYRCLRWHWKTKYKSIA